MTSADERNAGDDAADRDATREPPRSSSAEVLVAALGAAFVVAILTFLAYQAIAVPDTGPQLSAVVSTIEPVDDHFVAHVRVENDGDQAASGVSIVAELSKNGRKLQEANTTISYLPPTSFRSAALLFTRDPREATLALRIVGYELP